MSHKGDDQDKSYKKRYAKDVIKPFFFVRFKINHHSIKDNSFFLSLQSLIEQTPKFC